MSCKTIWLLPQSQAHSQDSIPQKWLFTPYFLNNGSSSKQTADLSAARFDMGCLIISQSLELSWESSKIRLMRFLVTSIFLYASESWTLTAELQRRIQAMEMRCYRKILHISYKDHATNKEICAKIQQAIGPHEDLLMIIKRCKLQWYGHVSHSSGLAKTISQGTVKGWRRQGRQRKRWEDNIREWTGMEFSMSQRAVENREKWRTVVANSSVVVPQRPLRLRDWWWWWWRFLFSTIFRLIVSR